MTVNFCPNREQLVKEVEQCIAASKLDVLVSLCTCCVYTIFDETTLVGQCLKCSIQQGIAKLSQRGPLPDEADLEFLGVC
jgi:hypothetical protein